jgi:hypothetical protein
MPEGKLSLEDALVLAAGGTPNPNQPDPNQPDPNQPDSNQPDPNQPDPNQPDPNQPDSNQPDPKQPDPNQPATTGKNEEQKPNPMKELRDKYNAEKTTREKIDSAIQRFTEGDYDFKLKDFKTEDGKVDYDAVIKAMDAADIKAKAESRGISPEVQAEIERIEKEKVELQKQRLQVAMDKALTNMQLDLKITSADINNFFKDALAANKNPYAWLAQGGSLHDLYNIIYNDRLVQAKIEAAVNAARAKWEEEARIQKKVPAPNPAQPTQPQPQNPNGISLEQLLTEAASKKI